VGRDVRILAEKEKVVSYQIDDMENSEENSIEDRNICEVSLK
jgi:hypothetical protein